jgi:DNA-binding CsgD family transcriptional regulator
MQRVVAYLYPETGRFPGDIELFSSLIHQHPLITYYQRTGDGRALRISDFLSDAEFRALDLYKRFYQRFGISYQMSVTLPAPLPLIIGIALNRTDCDFTERDRLALNLLRPHLEYLHHRLQSQSRTARRFETLHEALDAAGQGLLALDPAGTIGEFNVHATRILNRFADERLSVGAPPPRSVASWLSEQRRGLRADIDGTAPSEPLILERPDGRLVCRYLPAVRSGERDLVILVPEPTANASPFASYGLTAREAEILAMVAGGKTNAGIAGELVISERTVQKHLEHIFKKLGVANRTGAAALLIEDQR